jgi:glycerol uptake facilitator-like aquaporin
MAAAAAVDLRRRAAAEALGTALLLATVIGSGIMGERLAGGNVAIALLANTIATGAGLVALILTFGPISGAHFNPAVTLADASQGGIGWRDVPIYIGAQVAGAFAGVAVAHVMFGEPLFFASHHVRTGAAQWVSEFVATFGLLATIWGVVRRRSSAVPFAVGAYITAAYWFTSSTSFANRLPASAPPTRPASSSPSSSGQAPQRPFSVGSCLRCPPTPLASSIGLPKRSTRKRSSRSPGVREIPCASS